MTLLTTKSSETFQGNGVTQGFSCEFRIFDESDVVVTLIDQPTGTATPMVLNTDYTIAQTADDQGFTVATMVPVPNGKNLLVQRQIAYEQPTSFTNQSRFFPTLHQDMADRLAMQIQQIRDAQDLVLSLPPGLFPTGQGQLPYPVGGTLLGWSADGSHLANLGPTGIGAGQITDVNISAGAGIAASKMSYQQGGAGAILRVAQEKMRDEYTVKDFGALPDGATDASAPIQSIKTAGAGSALVKFVQSGAGGGTYKLNSLGTTDLNGLTLDVPQGVTLQLPNSSGSNLTSVNLVRQTRLLFPDIGNCDFYGRPKTVVQRDKTQFIGAGDIRSQRLTSINGSTDLVYRSIATSGTDTFGVVGPTTTATNSYIYGTSFALSAWYGGFISICRGETYSATFDRVGTGAVGVMFRHTGGYSVLSCDPSTPDTSLMIRNIKATGIAVATAADVNFPGRGSYQSYSPVRSVWGVKIVDTGKAVITLNGRALTNPVWDAALGDIIEVAFVWQPTSGASSCAIYDMTIEKVSDPLGNVEIPEVRCFGDSTTEDFLGGWTFDLKDVLDLTFGVKVGLVTNYAVAGTNSANVVASIATNGLGVASYVVVAIGTNDIQGGSPLAGSDSNMRSIINSIKTAGRVPVIVLPYMWYGQSQAIAGRGQPSTNYNAGHLLRARWMRICADLGAVMVDPTRELPEPKPSYVTSDTTQDPLLRDNIHQSALGYKLYARAIGRAIASYHSQLITDRRYGVNFANDWLPAGWAKGSGARLWRSDDGHIQVQSNFAPPSGTIAVATTIMTLPRWARPTGPMTFTVSSNTGPCQLTVNTNGTVVVDQITGTPNNMSTNFTFSTN